MLALLWLSFVPLVAAIQPFALKVVSTLNATLNETYVNPFYQSIGLDHAYLSPTARTLYYFEPGANNTNALRVVSGDRSAVETVNDYSQSGASHIRYNSAVTSPQEGYTINDDGNLSLDGVSYFWMACNIPESNPSYPYPEFIYYTPAINHDWCEGISIKPVYYAHLDLDVGSN